MPLVFIPGPQEALQGDMSLLCKEHPKATERQKHNALKRFPLANVSTCSGQINYATTLAHI